MQPATESVPATPREQLRWVTGLRVLAILGVVSIHNAAPNASDPDARQTAVGNLAIALDLAFIFAVPLFVMVSGALLLDPERFRSSGQFLRKRTARLLPPIVFWHVFYVVLNGQLSGEWPDPAELTRRVMTGQVAVHLYFFWIVLGLAVLAPVLVHWIAQTTRREWLVGGLIAVGVPVLTAVTTTLRGEEMTFVHTAWTWWVPYLGVFILGWALRGIVLAGPARVGAVALTVVLVVDVVWRWRNPSAPDWLQTIAPVNYYGPTVTLLTVLVFLLGQSLRGLRRGRSGRSDERPLRRRMGWVDEIGAATLGIFALHLAVLQLVIEWEWFGPGPTTVPLLIVRYAVVLAITVAIVLPLRRVPYVRAVL